MRNTDNEMYRDLLRFVIESAILAACLLVNATCAGPAQGKAEPATGPELKRYVDFLEDQRERPIAYLLRLFEKYDLVVICERFHAELTQYDLIFDLLKEPQFQQRVGSVFTEIGGAALQDYVDSFFGQEGLTERQVNEKLRYIAAHMGYNAVWEKSNYYELVRTIYRLDQVLPKERYIHLYPCDLDFDWEHATQKTWDEFREKQLSSRDRAIAQHIIGRFKRLPERSNQKKALVILNYRHAFPHLAKKDNATEKVENTCGYLMEAFPGKVANVMLNSVALLPSAGDHRSDFTAIQNGKWDAAFALVGNRELAFDFGRSPFGDNAFDYWPFFPTGLRYKDLFTGFVFWKPLEKHRLSWGSPVFDASLQQEILRRFKLMRREPGPEERKMIESLGEAHVFGYREESPHSDCFERIDHWLRAPHNPGSSVSGKK